MEYQDCGILIARGNDDIAVGEFELIEQLLGEDRQAIYLLDLAYGYSRVGDTANAQRLYDEIVALSDEQEIGAIADFIADLDVDIPYSLLAFHPQFYMSDLPVTSKDHAERCYQAARDAGLKNVRIGNTHLLA